MPGHAAADVLNTGTKFESGTIMFLRISRFSAVALVVAIGWESSAKGQGVGMTTGVVYGVTSNPNDPRSVTMDGSLKEQVMNLLLNRRFNAVNPGFIPTRSASAQSIVYNLGDPLDQRQAVYIEGANTSLGRYTFDDGSVQKFSYINDDVTDDEDALDPEDTPSRQDYDRFDRPVKTTDQQGNEVGVRYDEDGPFVVNATAIPGQLPGGDPSEYKAQIVSLVHQFDAEHRAAELGVDQKDFILFGAGGELPANTPVGQRQIGVEIRGSAEKGFDGPDDQVTFEGSIFRVENGAIDPQSPVFTFTSVAGAAVTGPGNVLTFGTGIFAQRVQQITDPPNGHAAGYSFSGSQRMFFDEPWLPGDRRSYALLYEVISSSKGNSTIRADNSFSVELFSEGSSIQFTVPSATAIVPEPSAGAMLLCGLLLVARLRRII